MLVPTALLIFICRLLRTLAVLFLLAVTKVPPIIIVLSIININSGLLHNRVLLLLLNRGFCSHRCAVAAAGTDLYEPNNNKVAIEHTILAKVCLW